MCNLGLLNKKSEEIVYFKKVHRCIKKQIGYIKVVLWYQFQEWVLVPIAVTLPFSFSFVYDI